MRAKPPHPDTLRLPAHRLARAIRRGALCPVALMAATLRRIERLNPQLNAFVTLRARAVLLAEAQHVKDRRATGQALGPLAGLPVAIKDATPVQGLRCTYGAPLMAAHVAEEDAVIVQRLQHAGAIILGKTNTSEFTAGANTTNRLFGPTRHPLDPELTCGGSTGGGAVAVATGMAALSDGTDLGGSLRVPAAFCGVVGLRPTPGRVPLVPAQQPYDRLQVPGGITRTVEDQALLLRVIAGAHPGHPPSAGTAPFAMDQAPDRVPRLAFCPDPVKLGLDAGIAAVTRRAAQRAGATLIDLDLTPARAAFAPLRAAFMAAEHHSRLAQLERLGAHLRGNIEHGLQQSGAELARAEAQRGEAARRMRALFERYDVLLCPTSALMPFPIADDFPRTLNGTPLAGYVDWLAPMFVFSLLGLPALTIPCGAHPESRLPVGLQLVAPAFAEPWLLTIGAWLSSRLAAGLAAEDAEAPASGATV